MSQISVNLDQGALREMTTQAILNFMTPEKKEELIREAINKILSPSKDSWDKGKSPIEVAFKDSCEFVAREVCRDMVAKDEGIQTKLKELLRKVAEKIFTLDQDKIAEKMADAFVYNMSRTDR